MITFVTASNDEEVLRKNLLASPLATDPQHEILVKRNVDSITGAYNSAIDEARHDIIVFAHHDIFFPQGWDENLLRIISRLDHERSAWGVLGCYGITGAEISAGFVYSNGLQKTLGWERSPQEVDVLDEIVLIIRKSSGLRFDPGLPGFHLYGTDLCFEARRRGLRSYAISNYCIHNSLPLKNLNGEFWECAAFIRKKWTTELPIVTNCAVIHRNAFRYALHRLRKKWYYFRRNVGIAEVVREDNVVSLSIRRNRLQRNGV